MNFDNLLSPDILSRLQHAEGFAPAVPVGRTPSTPAYIVPGVAHRYHLSRPAVPIPQRPSWSENEQRQLHDTGELYIRMVGTTSGTLERIKKTVHAQLDYYQIDPPDWLQPEFIYKINFGPATRDNVADCQRHLRNSRTLPGGRRSLTLLDREMAKILHNTLFPNAGVELFDGEANGDENPAPEIPPTSLTPFDYPADPTIDTLMRFEEYVVFTMWSESYSTSLLGSDRPPMAAVARDLISLVLYLQGFMSQGIETRDKKKGKKEKSPLLAAVIQPPMAILEVLKCFCADRVLFSISSTVRESIAQSERVSRLGFLVDLLTLAISLGRTDYGRDELRVRIIPSSNRILGGVSDLEFLMWPGPDTLQLGKPPLERAAFKDLWGSLTDMTAAFIDSGPYSIELSERASDHLTLSSRGRLRVFWEGPKFWKAVGENTPLFPGHHTFVVYKTHRLGKLLEATTLYDEILRTFSLLFTRDERSKKIAKNLFKAHNATLLIATRDESKSESIVPQIVLKTVDGKITRPKDRCVIIPEWSVYFRGHSPMYAHFHHYRGHFALVDKQMSEWKPRTFRELFIPGYKDRFTWQATWISLGFASLGVLILICSVWQTVMSTIQFVNS